MTYLTKKEREIESKYLEQGYVIQDVENVEALAWIRNCLTNIIKQNTKQIKEKDPESILNNIQDYVSPNKLNKSHYVTAYLGTQVDKISEATTSILTLMI